MKRIAITAAAIGALAASGLGFAAQSSAAPLGDPSAEARMDQIASAPLPHCAATDFSGLHGATLPLARTPQLLDVYCTN